MFYLYIILVSIFISSSAFARTIEYSGIDADNAFSSFLGVYASKQTKSLIHGIPIHGKMRTILTSMLLVHAAKRIDPNSIDILLKNYHVDGYALQCKKLFISMLSELKLFDRIIPGKVIIHTDEAGRIIGVIAESYGNKHGKMNLGKQYFKDVNMYIHELSVKSGERQ